MFTGPAHFHEEHLWRRKKQAEAPVEVRVDAITLEAISRLACAVCKVARPDFLSARRSAPYVRARHIYFTLAKEFTTKSYPQIGRHCGGKDHTTVMHGHRKVAQVPDYYEPELSHCRAVLHRFAHKENNLGS